MSKILAIDIGMGTIDALLYDSSKNIENCIKFVMPTPSRRYLKSLKKIKLSGKEKIWIYGDTIGGGPLAHELIGIAEEKRAEVMVSETAGYTIRNDPDEVRGFGIKIIPEPDVMRHAKDPEDAGSVFIDKKDIVISFIELELPFLRSFFEQAGEDMLSFDGICVCAQDHGVCKKEISDRKHRFEEFTKILNGSRVPTPYSFCFKNGSVPDTFRRLKSLENKIKTYLPSFPMIIMDSSPAALLGCFAYADEYRELNKKKLAEPYLMVNMGNNHAIFVVVKKERILAFYEHHSWVYDEDPAKLEKHIKRFCDGELPSDEIFEDEGNGSIYFDPPGFSKIKNIIVTGPNRNIFRRTGLSVHYSAVGGDMMMSGPVGLVRGFERIYGV